MTVRVTPEAREDVRDAASWYAERGSTLAGDFVAAFSDAIVQLSQFPESASCIHGEIRRILLRRFPYCVFYLLEPDPVVLGCFHARRDPRAWQARTGV